MKYTPSRILNFLKHNAIALAALFIALGGTSYAAISLPRNSVGTQQLRNHAVTPSKLAGGLGEQVWGTFTVGSVTAGGAIGSSYPKGAKVKAWHTTTNGYSGIISLPRRYPKGCVPMANVEGPSAQSVNVIPSVSVGQIGNTSELQVYGDSIYAFQLAILCPRGA